MNIKKLLIIGDSLSFNAYDYDPKFRLNSYDCFPDMGSWSFCLRDELIKSSRGLVFGADLAESQTDFSHTVFGDRAFCGLAGVELLYRYQTDTITLYLQKHPEGGAYRVEIDDGFASCSVDFKGDAAEFHARNIFAVTLPADPALVTHNVSLKGVGPFTLLGISCERKEANIRGRGSQTVRFFVDNFDEWVKKYEFDTLLSILGANDFKHTSLTEFDENYTKLIEMIRALNRDARVFLMLPPDLSDPDDPDSDRSTYCSKKTAAPYLDIVCRLADKYGLRVIDTRKPFENISIPQWRYDDAHFNKFGNRLLFENLWDELQK